MLKYIDQDNPNNKDDYQGIEVKRSGIQSMPGSSMIEPFSNNRRPGWNKKDDNIKNPICKPEYLDFLLDNIH